jgi:hypothetical protein
MKVSKRSGKRPHTLVVPVAFDPQVHLDPGLMRYQDQARYVLDRIFWRKKHERLSPDSMVRLKTKYMAEFFPDHKVVKKVLESMERNGAFQIDRPFVLAGPGRTGRCRGYRPTPEILGDGYINHTPSDKFLVKRIDTWRKERDRRLRPIHRHLIRYLKYVDFDLEGARRAVLEHHERSPLVRGKKGQMRERDVAAALVLVERFAAGGHEPIVDHYGRFHYGLSSLPSVARGCVTYRGQPLVFLDIACSQPFFLGMLHLASRSSPGYFDDWKRLDKPEDYLKWEIDEDFLDKLVVLSSSSSQLPHSQASSSPNMGKDEEIQEEGGEGAGVGSLLWGFCDSNYPKPMGDNKKDDKTNDLVEQETRIPPMGYQDDVDRYMGLVTTGGFYEALMEELNVPLDNREDFKRTLYQNVYYGKVRVQKGSVEGKAFRRMFPTMHDLLLDLKEGQHQRSSRLMQKLEAHFIYDRICGRIESERPQIFLGTIHDALVTTPDQAGYVRRVMTDEFARVGVTPTIRDK